MIWLIGVVSVLTYFAGQNAIHDSNKTYARKDDDNQNSDHPFPVRLPFQPSSKAIRAFMHSPILPIL
jgi:hypothetical protein